MGSRRFPWGPRTPETSVEFSFLGIHDLHAPAWVLGFGSRKRWTAPGGFLGLPTLALPATCLWIFGPSSSTSRKWNILHSKIRVGAIGICSSGAWWCLFASSQRYLWLWIWGRTALELVGRAHCWCASGATCDLDWLGLESGRAWKGVEGRGRVWKGVEGCGRVWNLRFQKAHVI